MRNTRTRFEQVPVEVAEKALELQHRFAKRDGGRKLVVRKSRRTHRGLRGRFKKAQVSR
jgi:hypothetical protein